MYMSSWDKSYLESYKEKCEKLEKENEKYIITFSSLYDNDRQYTKKIKEQEDLLDTMSGQLVELKNTVIDVTTDQNLRAQIKELQSENEHLKSKFVDVTMFQNLQVQVEELKSENESLTFLVIKLTKACEHGKANLKQRDEKI
ncbi:hypothetical protein Tco_0741462, partial [Tanacetum coccineum]